MRMLTVYCMILTRFYQKCYELETMPLVLRRDNLHPIVEDDVQTLKKLFLIQNQRFFFQINVYLFDVKANVQVS